MGQSLAQNYIHLIFGTKGRIPLIPGEKEDDLHAYIAGILKNYDSPALKINSMPDHIHILFRLSKNYPLTKVVEEVKKTSSKWMKLQGAPTFTWQIGYGAFSVSSSKVATVENYIHNQKEHHKHKTFQEEVEEFILKYRLTEYDRDFFWK